MVKEEKDKTIISIYFSSGYKQVMEVTIIELNDLRDAIMRAVINPISEDKRFREDSYFELASKNGTMVAFRISSVDAVEFKEEYL